MSNKNLSSVATAVIESYGNTAINMINAYRVGGERVIGFVDQRFEAAVNTGAARLSDELRSNLIDTEKRISGYYSKGLQFGTERAETVVSSAVELANKGVAGIAANAERFDQATKIGALDMINRVALPAATAMSEVVVRIEEGSSQLVKKVAGKPAVVKAVAKKAKTAKKAVAKTVKKATATKKAVVRKTTVVARKTGAAVRKAAAAA
ncbi:MAG: hypothetical protein MUF08_04970 [Burkholderiaceae bacterium]|jgi:hypothetical protein|nr:hypothetical protein [Burkholderiaceae bacterium]